MKNSCLLSISSLFVICYLFLVPSARAASFASQPSPLSASVPKYGKFEISFKLNTSATNPFFPFDASAPIPRQRGTGISVDMFVSPGTTVTTSAQSIPCFYYQPVEIVRPGTDERNLLPYNSPEWRCRFAPEQEGTFAYVVRAQDSSGKAESNQQTFTATAATSHGFVRVSPTDKRFFEFSDGTQFVFPLTYVENFGSDLKTIDDRVDALGNNGIRFVRWFPNEEFGSTVPYAGQLGVSWGYGPTWTTIENPDTAKGKIFSFEPYYWSNQRITAVDGATYKLDIRARVEGDKHFMPYLSLSTQNKVQQTITANGGWSDYSLTITNSGNNSILGVGLQDGTSETDGMNTSGTISIGSVTLRKLISPGVWGPNLIERGDPNTFEVVDQIAAAKLDEIFARSEAKGVYHKTTLFHKNDLVYDKMLPDGTTGDWTLSNFYTPLNSASYWYKKANVRYFIARWSYSTALHSLELANENDVGSSLGLDMSLDVAQYVHALSPRRVLMSNSFWHWNGLPMSYWAEPDMDFVDKHWYAETKNYFVTGNTIDCATNPSACDVISGTWQDTALNVRQCYTRFKEYAQQIGVVKPILRGETGVAKEGTGPQLGDNDGISVGIKQEMTGTYYVKKIWSQIGALGASCDGEWYSRFWNINSDQLAPEDALYNTYYPTTSNNTFKFEKNFAQYMLGEHLSNGKHIDIGTDGNSANGIEVVQSSNSNLRAFGARDTQSGRVLIWVDNKNNTWRNPNYSTVANGDITVTVPNGIYTQEVWDTRAGTHTTNANAFNVTNGHLVFPVSTAKDVAYKFYNNNSPVVTTTVSPTTTPAHCTPLGNIDCLGKVSAIDLSTLISKFGTTDATANLNDLGKVDVLDLSILLSNYGK